MSTLPRHAAIVVAGGACDEDTSATLPDGLPADAFIIAADSGLLRAEALGLRVDLVVGDLDSVSQAAITAAEAAGIPIERHSTQKDSTDLELALDAAITRGARHIIVIGGDGAGKGSRLDHLLANILLLGSRAYAQTVLEAYLGPAHLAVVHAGSSIELHGAIGTLCSIVPIGGPATVRTIGLRYPMDDVTLPASTTLGVSNEFSEAIATISTSAGTALVVQPDFRSS